MSPHPACTPAAPTHAAGADVLLVGGGLANSLIAWRLAAARPDLRVVVLEAGDALGGNHTWCFHAGDVNVHARRWLAPLVLHRWHGYEVRFPERRRTLPDGYLALTSAHLREVLAAVLPTDAVRLHARVSTLHADGAVLASGERIAARVVVDGRGWRDAGAIDLGYQKFVGVECELAGPHGLERPILMDARVPQLDGFRFVYVLPLGERRVLVEDTRYSDGPELDVPALRDASLAYAERNFGRIADVVREERGVLPIALRGDLRRHLGADDGVARVGLAAGLFHPTTGYSLPDAVRVADLVAADPLDDGRGLAARVRAYALASWERRGFYRFLNRMLFDAARPPDRWRVLQRFYGLDAGLVARFYADRLTVRDHVRLLTGRPPVRIADALACIPERGRTREPREVRA